MAFLRKGFLKSAHRRNELRAGIDLSVAAIISFFLLVMFMVLPQPEPRIAVALVVSRYTHYLPAAMRDDAITVILTRDGTVFLGNSKIHPDDLPDRIREAVRNGAEKRIYLELDAHARYGEVNVLLHQIQRSGIENVSLIADSPRPVAPPFSLPTR